MPVDERSRHALYLKLEEILGRQEATTLMEHLPPVGWADVATKHDLDQLAAATKHDLDQFAQANQREHEHLAEVNRREHEALENRLLAQFRAEFVAQTRTFVLSLFGAFLTSTGIAVAAARAL
jgi:hypothetical protein